MNEEFLSFIWKHQYFDHSALQTPSGDKITVLRPGHRNADAGPDFFEARLEIDGLLWAGTIEIHVRTSGWNAHGHVNDKAYGSVILHVVWENDVAAEHYPNTHIPLLELKNLVSPGMLTRYWSMQEALSDFPCKSRFGEIPMLEKNNMVDKALIERLEHKSAMISAMLDRNNGDWDETSWQLLARYFGAKINAGPFQDLAERIPLKILLRHRNNLLQLEALLFGIAGLIPAGPSSGYISDLRREYRFLARKYGLGKNKLDAIEWKMLRLRPAGFPTVRIAQLASLVHRNGNIFSLLTTSPTAAGYAVALKSVQSAYWHTHYHFGKPAGTLIPLMGTDAIHILIINVVAPILATYAFKTDNRNYLDKAVRLLEETPAENNKIIREWKKLGLKLTSSASSQGALEWYHRYCALKRCLHCNVGNSLLKKGIRTDRDRL